MKVIFLKKATLLILVSILVFFSAFSLERASIDVSGAYFVSAKKVPIYSVATDENKLSISFDAAWGADKTSEIMNVCDSYGVKATFFLVGFWVEKYPEKVLEIYNRGFEIGIHSNSHPDMTKLSKSEIRNELETNIKLVENITCEKPKLFRPPYGYYNNNLIDVCDDLGLKCIEWSVDSLDWKDLSAGDVAGRVIKKSNKGSIVLFHNNSKYIDTALKMVLESYKLKNMEVVPIGKLIYYDNYTINNQGVQINKIIKDK